MDLELEDVAELLNLSEATVKKLVSDGALPAYRIQESLRFSPEEIEDWVFSQHLDGTLPPEIEAPHHSGLMRFGLYRALYRGDCLYNESAKTKEELIEASLKPIAESLELDPAILTDLFLDRERLMPTALGHGIAVPHSREILLDAHFDLVTVVFPKEPIEYGALDGEPVHSLFFLLASEETHHLHLLAKIAHLMAQPQSRAFFQGQPSKKDLLSHIKAWEQTLS